jgi:hypothetical protein
MSKMSWYRGTSEKCMRCIPAHLLIYAPPINLCTSLILPKISVRKNRLHTVPEIPSINSTTTLTEETKSRRTSTISSQAVRIDRLNVRNPLYGSNNVSLYRI